MPGLSEAGVVLGAYMILLGVVDLLGVGPAKSGSGLRAFKSGREDAGTRFMARFLGIEVPAFNEACLAGV